VSDVAIRVVGLKEFQRNLKKLDHDLPKVLRLALNDVAEVVASDARSLVPRRSGRAAGSVKARSTQTLARVVGGSNRVPYYPWLDFGGRVGRRNSVSRPVIEGGRYLYPAYFRQRDRGRVQDELSRALIQVARQAGIEVT
jgi:hypothetical protein